MLKLHSGFAKRVVRTHTCITRCCSTSADKQKSTRTRARQHVNPLAWQHQQPIALEDDWIQRSFAQPQLPFVLDIGPARGTACATLAETNPQLNVLGLEIRKPMVELAMKRKAAKHLNNLHFLASNANVDLDRILKDIHQVSHVSMCTIHFPDPQFKKKHVKRRTVNPLLVQTMARHLRPGTVVSLRSDILDMMLQMHEDFKQSGAFEFIGEDEQDLTKNQPTPPVKTERELQTESKGLPVYRTLFKMKLEETLPRK